MTPEQFYRRVFLDNADEYKWSTEPIAIPRLQRIKYCGENNESVTHHKCIIPSNHKEHIAAGYVFDEQGEWVRPLRRLSASGHGKHSERQYNTFVCNINRKPNPTPSKKSWTFMFKTERNRFRKKWLLVSYNDDSLLHHVVFDVDVHSDDPQAKLQAEETLEALRKVERRFGIVPVTATSPGNLYNGEHIQGRYRYWFFENTVTFGYLKSVMPCFLELHGINCEALGAGLPERVRLPGQQWVEVCDEDGVLVDPVKDGEPMSKTLKVFMEHAFHAFKHGAVDPQVLFAGCERPVVKVKPKAKRQVKVVLGDNLLPDGSSILSEEEMEELRATDNTFDVCWTIAMKLVHRFKREHSTFESFSRQIRNELILSREKRNKTSETCSSPELTNGMVDYVAHYYWDRYDPTKCSGRQRVEDEARYCDTMSVPIRKVLAYCKFKGATETELISISAFLHVSKLFLGRVAFALRDSCFQGFGNFKLVRARFPELFVTLDEYCHAGKTCRQYGLGLPLLRRINDFPRAKAFYEKLRGRFASKLILPPSPLRNRIAQKYLATDPLSKYPRRSTLRYYELVLPLGTSDYEYFTELLKN